MGKISTNSILLCIVLIAFIYRFALMTINTFPPGADIGLHQSVINSITSPQPNFFENNYHMGGGLSVTNPGYHIFTAFVITMTALPDYLAQALVASFFSALILLSAFILTRYVWGATPAFVIAVLTVFSLGDIYMITWGGYPNIVALMLIPIVLSLFIRPTKISPKSQVAIASILVSAIFLTHVFSALVFVTITVLTLLISAVFYKKTGLSRKQAMYWLVPLALGAVLVSPYLFKVIPIYFSSEGTITGATSATSQAILQTRLIPMEITGLSLFAAFTFFVFSRFKYGKFLSIGAVLFAVWMLVPALATQTYLIGVYLDYERFLYFLALPAIACVGLIVARIPNVISRVVLFLQGKGRLQTKLPSTASKKSAVVIITSVLFICILFTPLFALPQVAVMQANYFQVMNSSEYQAINWIKTNTSAGSVCLADAEFGWWLSGFAQRPTLSAVAPQYLLLNHEVAPAKVAANLLSADYFIDNGLVEVKQDGAFANGSRHEISGIFHDSYIHLPIFTINDTQINLLYRENGSPKQLYLASLNGTETNVQTSQNQASFKILRENQLFEITEQITIFEGSSFARVSFACQNKTNNVKFDWLQLPFNSNGLSIQYDNSIAIADSTLHQLNQIVLPNSLLGNDVMFQENSDSYELIHCLYGNSAVKISFFVGTCQFSPNVSVSQIDAMHSIMENNTRSYLHKISFQPLNSFDYQSAIHQWNISYVALRDFAQLHRFIGDPVFEPVFKNDKVAIFKVNQT